MKITVSLGRDISEYTTTEIDVDIAKEEFETPEGSAKVKAAVLAELKNNNDIFHLFEGESSTANSLRIVMAGYDGNVVTETISLEPNQGESGLNLQDAIAQLTLNKPEKAWKFIIQAVMHWEHSEEDARGLLEILRNCPLPQTNQI